MEGCKKCNCNIILHINVAGEYVNREESAISICKRCGHVIAFVPIEQESIDILI
jgi:hypothetical protein